MRQGVGETVDVPGVWKRVADNEILVFLLLLPFGEVSRITDRLTNPLSDVEEIRLPGAALTFRIPVIIRIRQQRTIGVTHFRVIISKILNIARGIVDPWKRHALHVLQLRVPGVSRGAVVTVIAGTEVKLIDINIIERGVEVLLASTLQELSFDFGIINFSNRDRAELAETLVPDFAVEDDPAGINIGTVDMSEDSNIFRATAQGKGNSERITVRAGEESVFADELKRGSFFREASLLLT